MFGSELLEVVIGVVFVFLLISIICSAIREAIETIVKSRSAYLEHGIRELLHDPEGTDLAASFFRHPLIYGLYLDDYKPLAGMGRWGGTRRPHPLARGGGLPSYIPSKNFALAMMDLTARGRTTDALSSSPSSAPITPESLRRNVFKLRNDAVQRVMLSAIDTAEGDLKKVQANLEAWYDSSMDRVSGWYKRSTQVIVFLIALVVAIVCNVNTITISGYLYRNDAQRQVLVARAENAARDPVLRAMVANDDDAQAPAPAAPATDAAAIARADSATRVAREEYAAAMNELRSLGLPIGWSAPTALFPAGLTPLEKIGYFLTINLVGWLFTALAATLGAPFWFDILNKVMVIRSTVKPREKSRDEGSEDRQPKTVAPQVAVDGELAATTTLVPPPPAMLTTREADRVSMAMEQDLDDPEGGVDLCDLEIDDELPDDELPIATGGVAPVTAGPSVNGRSA